MTFKISGMFHCINCFLPSGKQKFDHVGKNLLKISWCPKSVLYDIFHIFFSSSPYQPKDPTLCAHTEQNWCGGFEERPQKSCWALSCGNLKSMDSVAPGRWQTFGVTYWLGVTFRHSEKVFQSAEASKWRHHHSGSFASYAWKINSGDSTGVAVCLWQVVLSACIVS